VWHKIGNQEVATFSPILADRIAANTADGIDSVAASIVSAVLTPGSPAVEQPSIARRFIQLLESDPSKDAVLGFLFMHERIVVEAFGPLMYFTLYWNKTMKSLLVKSLKSQRSTRAEPPDLLTFDLCIEEEEPSFGADWHVVLFERPTAALFLESSEPSKALSDALTKIESVRRWREENPAEDDTERRWLMGPNFKATVVIGRRSNLTRAELDSLRQFNNQDQSITEVIVDGEPRSDVVGQTSVRTYDHLIDAAVSLTEYDLSTVIDPTKSQGRISPGQSWTA
jgi:hypothetical protein